MRRQNFSLINVRWRYASAFFFVCLIAVFFLLATAASAQELSRSPGWVVIPVDQYRTLRAQAFPIEGAPEQPPVEATLTRVDYDLNVPGDLAAGAASLTVDVLNEGW